MAAGLAVVLVSGAWCGTALSATPVHSPKLPYKLGAYAGTLSQNAPRSYKGRIHFIVRRGKVTALTFKVGVVCHGVWGVETAAPTGFQTRVHRTGAFSYTGNIAGSWIRLRGTLKQHHATGTLLQIVNGCSMEKPASFTARS